ncbi:MAG: AAA family ATPase, partial [Muribaculaceae bacterium]|nr:AAA family ATPase [Muribaculaceae bacterium]
MEEKKEKYAIGDQDFKSLREGGYLYIDKTAYIKKILDGSKYYFLARPRRFGKSLFLSTLRYFFEGRRELFKGLYIDGTDWNWNPYPVIYIKFGKENYTKPGMLEKVLDNTFQELEERYGILDISRSYSMRLYEIIKSASKKSGKQVVILIDDYDKPMIDNLQNKETFDHCFNFLAGIYGNLKSNAENLALVFLTGTYQVSQYCDLHELNHLYDISDSSVGAGLCGFTQEEVTRYLLYGIERFALCRGLTQEEVMCILKDRYWGYRFSSGNIEVFNPWSILNALAYSEVRNFWNETGMPSEVRESLSTLDKSELSELNEISSKLRFSHHFARYGINLIGILYQNGYLTIKDY